MAVQKVLKVGKALYVCIPKIVVEVLALARGSKIDVKRIEGGFVVTKVEEGKPVRDIFD